MGFAGWLRDHGFDALQSAGIVAGLFSVVYTVRDNSRTRRVENLLRITESHRDMWSAFYRTPDLKRVLESEPRHSEKPITAEERLFARFLILHLAAVFQAKVSDEFFELEGLKQDIRQTFSLPIPAEVWAEMRPYQSREFVLFIDSTLRGQDPARRESAETDT